MKKLLLIIPIVALLAVRCTSSQQASNHTPAQPPEAPNTNLTTLSINPGSLEFTVQQDAASHPTQMLAVSLSSGANDVIKTSVSYKSGDGWLTIGNSTVHVGTPGSVMVTVNPSNLSVGSYMATISVSDSGIATSVPVTLTVSAPVSNAAPTSQDTATWQTFTHTDTISNVQISFKYPVDWTIGTINNSPDEFTIQPTNTFEADSFNSAIVLGMSEQCQNPSQCPYKYSLDQLATHGYGTILKTITLKDGTKGDYVKNSNGTYSYLFMHDNSTLVVFSTDVYAAWMAEIAPTLQVH